MFKETLPVLHSSALRGSRRIYRAACFPLFKLVSFAMRILTFRESTAAYMMSIQPLKVAWETESVIRLCLLGSGWESRQSPKGQG